MFDPLRDMIVSLGTSKVKDLLINAVERTLKKYNNSREWKKLLAGLGDFFTNHEKEENSFFSDLSVVLSKKNMERIADEIKDVNGFELKQKLYSSLMQLMAKYEIQHETAEAYSRKIIFAVLEEIKRIDPDKYEHFFQQDWRDEQEKINKELKDRLDKIEKNIILFTQEKIDTLTAGQMDLLLRRSTKSPSIGINFFCS